MKTPGKRPAFFLSIVERAFPRLRRGPDQQREIVRNTLFVSMRCVASPRARHFFPVEEIFLKIFRKTLDLVTNFSQNTFQSAVV